MKNQRRIARPHPRSMIRVGLGPGEAPRLSPATVPIRGGHDGEGWPRRGGHSDVSTFLRSGAQTTCNKY
ncbi:hypothetical protein CHELA17_20296 [Chelatococcus asaccharovorans]|nr:hypothetical protein CHELA17_20296 [Chelatococcus asaccharovorans]